MICQVEKNIKKVIRWCVCALSPKIVRRVQLSYSHAPGERVNIGGQEKHKKYYLVSELRCETWSTLIGHIIANKRIIMKG